MKITLEMPYSEAVELREYLRPLEVGGESINSIACDVCDALDSAIDNYEPPDQEPDYSREGESESYRRDMKDAGRGHLLR